jgi:hypothetical protein
MMLLVTGASGVGKSTVRRLITEELEPEVRAVELTQIAGPPTYERGWRQRAVEEVVQVALAEQEAGRHLLLIGDPVPPGEVLAAPSADRLDGFAACFLDCAPEEQSAGCAGAATRRTSSPTTWPSPSGCASTPATRATGSR